MAKMSQLSIINEHFSITPASLRQQWRAELWDKFALRFEVVDRQGTERLRRLGMDATPWRSFSRIIASYHHLHQPTCSSSSVPRAARRKALPHLPWDLLIVDECHNLFSAKTASCTAMLRLVVAQFGSDAEGGPRHRAAAALGRFAAVSDRF